MDPYCAVRTTDPWVYLPPPRSRGSGLRVFSKWINRLRVSSTRSVSSSTSSFGSPSAISCSRRYCRESRFSPTIRARSMSCCEERVRVNVLFSIPQIYGEGLDWPNRVGENYRSSTLFVNHTIRPTIATMIPTIIMMSPINQIYFIVGVKSTWFFIKKPPR